LQDRREEMEGVLDDHDALLGAVRKNGWDLAQDYDVDRMKRPLLSAQGLSLRAASAFSSVHFDRAIENRRRNGRPMSLGYVVRRATTLDWSVLDVFYRLCGMDHFRSMFDLAQRGEDEGPICNLTTISQYLARFMEEYLDLIGGEYLQDHLFTRMLFGSFLYALWRLGESEFENREDPFPRGRIPFLTVHQAKGLEFPIVVLPYPRKIGRSPQATEIMVRPFLEREDAEPLDRIAEFDAMRMFYVALSRAQNLLIIGRYSGRGQVITEPIKSMLLALPSIASLDLESIPKARRAVDEDLPRTYSYTGDYLAYQRCPRQYMIFRKYGFEASQTRTLFFGSLVHRTLDDLHNHLIARREQGAGS
jgi:DNA helicase-2/ATP-dependent DNA helicase PcrA